MNKEELQHIIDNLEKEAQKKIAYFGIFEYGEGPDESFIKANKQGLELFALELLKAARDSDELLKDESEKSIYPLEFDDDWIDVDSTTYINYIEPTSDIRTDIKQVPYVETWKEKIMKFGCLSAIVIAIISAIVGIGTIVEWIT